MSTKIRLTCEFSCQIHRYRF